MRVTHDVALLHLAIFLEEAADLFLGESGVDAGDEEVGARVHSVVVASVRWRAASIGVSQDATCVSEDALCLPAVTAVDWLIANSSIAITVTDGRAGAVARWWVVTVVWMRSISCSSGEEPSPTPTI